MVKKYSKRRNNKSKRKYSKKRVSYKSKRSKKNSKKKQKGGAGDGSMDWKHYSGKVTTALTYHEDDWEGKDSLRTDPTTDPHERIKVHENHIINLVGTIGELYSMINGGIQRRRETGVRIDEKFAKHDDMLEQLRLFLEEQDDADEEHDALLARHEAEINQLKKYVNTSPR